jgi:hypothetical protein
MARPGLDKHPKFLMLRRMLGEPRPHVRGYLDCLWESAYENGDPILGTAAMVEAVAEYPGEAGKLFASLLNCGGEGRAGFIEESPGRPGVYQVHDLYDHAPDYVRKRYKREMERRTTADNGGQRQSVADNGAPPAPAPAPIPELNKFNSGQSNETAPARGEKSPGRPRKARKQPTGAHAEFIRVFQTTWQGRYGRKMPFNGGKDGAHFQWFREQLADDVGRWKAVVASYFREESDFYRGHPVGLLKSHFTRFCVGEEPAMSESERLEAECERQLRAERGQ